MSRPAAHHRRTDEALALALLDKALVSDGAKARVVDRDPCIGCGVRRDRHAEFGCRRWMGA